MSQVLLDAAGRPRLPATLPGFHAGRPPRNKGRRYPADPPTIESRSQARLAARSARQAGRRREVGMDEWAWEQLQPWLDARAELPVGPLFCIITGPTGPKGDHEQRARFEDNRAALNDSADKVAEDYDALLERAIQLGLLD